MAFFDQGDLKEIVSADASFLHKLMEPWRSRHDVWDEMVYPSYDDNLIAQRHPSIVYSDVAKDRQLRSQYRSNFVGSGVKNLINRLSRAEPIIEDAQTLTATEDLAQMEKGSETELFGYGLLNYLDQQMVDQAEGTGWLRRMYSFFAHPGKAVGLVRLHGGRENLAEVSVDLLDPYQVSHDFTRYVRRLTYQRVIPAMAARAELERVLEDRSEFEFIEEGAAGLSSGKNDLKLTDYWLEERAKEGMRVWYGLLVEDKLVALRKMPHKHLPIVVVSCNTLGRTYQGGIGETPSVDGISRARPRDYIARHAEPWFAPIEETIKLYNTVKSLEVDGIDLMIRPPLITRSEDGGFVIEDQRLFGGLQIPLRSTDFIEFLKYTNEAIVANSTVLASLERDLAYEFPDALRGLLAADRESGYLFNLRTTDAAENATQEYVRGSALFTERVLAEVIHQFKENKQLKITLSGNDYRGTEQGAYFHQDFQPSTFADSTVLKVRLGAMLPKTGRPEAVRLPTESPPRTRLL